MTLTGQLFIEITLACMSVSKQLNTTACTNWLNINGGTDETLYNIAMKMSDMNAIYTHYILRYTSLLQISQLLSVKLYWFRIHSSPSLPGLVPDNV